MSTTKRAQPHFRVAEFADGTPLSVMERYKGEDLDIFRSLIGFDLKPGTTYAAKEIERYLEDKLITVAETK